ncbi:lipoxygenase family protein [Nitrosococcus watsonii]|uniref:Arachidonate 15-lipoxygenase n=1 Tax=Nitrosococcus watsoni (strain C-113) TaxID=105559 RepID=D8K5R3_NITWC|nr:lipoxygenase family protein [Nitrosococcus watsonii]ADJ28240.1 Arachidonate 15-lipoxygenase [Nitrosococcus watsonii C-113]
MNTSLPQNDSDPQGRKDRLERRRALYVFNYDYVPPIPMIDKVPHEEYFSPKYTAERLASMAKLAPNMLAAKTKRLFDPLDELNEYDEMFIFLDKPGIVRGYRTDESFGEQRLSGVNPMSIRRLDKLPEDFPIMDEYLEQSLGSPHTLAQALQEGRLYFLEFPQLAHVKEGGLYRGRKKYLPKPRALFCWDGNHLQPVAIQISGQPGGRLFIPRDSDLDWFVAKLCVQIADANHQELGTHFARTHVVMAPFAVVTHRQLAENHPLHILLRPHFRFMLYDNDLGRTRFIQPDGPVEHMMAGTLEESIGISAAFYKEWRLDEAAFPIEIARRKMDDPEVLPHYPFRDDGMLLWDGIQKFVKEYLALYYQSPEDLVQDQELRNWARELTANDGGRVAGMPGRIETVDQLTSILSTVIYTCAPLHSALNFAQYEYIGYVPNMPYAAYHPIPEEGGVDMETLMKILPPYEQAALQLKWTEILTSYHYDRLGHYDEKFEDPQAQAVVEQFQQELAAVEQEIDQRNQDRPLAYTYLKPSEIINSINT